MRWWTLSLLPALVAAATSDCIGENAVNPTCSSNEAAHKRDIFYIGFRYVNDPTFNGDLIYDQMYVEKLVPASGIRQPYPLVFFHGGGTSGVVSDPPSSGLPDRDTNEAASSVVAANPGQPRGLGVMVPRARLRVLHRRRDIGREE